MGIMHPHLYTTLKWHDFLNEMCEWRTHIAKILHLIL
jgi:hypothetical protein